MLTLTIQTNGTRKDAIVTVDTTVQQVIADNNIDTTNASIMVGGRVANPSDTLADLGFNDGDNPFMNITVKSTNNADITVNYVNNTLTVVSCLKKETIEKAIGVLKVTDEEKGDLYAVEVSKNGVGGLSKKFFKGNTYTSDGYLACVEIFPMDTTVEQVKKIYADALLAAEKYLPLIAEAAEEKAAKLEELFDSENEAE